MTAPSMPCSKCLGRGHVPLPPELMTTLGWLRKGPLTAKLLHAKMGGLGASTAANNRLEHLRQLGYATRELGDRKTWIYTAVRTAL